MIDALTARVRGIQTVITRATLELLLVAALPAIAPRGAAPTLAMIGIVGAWVLTTSRSGERIELWRLLGLAAFLYLAHSLAALAAALPYDAVVAPEVLARWIARAVVVVIAAAAIGVILVAIAGVGGDRTLLAAAVGGLVVAVGLAGLLGWLSRRRV